MMQGNIALIVDDSLSMRQILRMTLSQIGFEVIEAENGEEGFRQAQRRHADIVLTDINMPVMDGFAFIEKLRSLPDYRHTPVLTLTTTGSDQHRQRGREVGATGWVTKPFNPEKLLGIVKKLLT